MNQLLPCPECSRHVRVSETECPFCALPLDFSGTPEPVVIRERLSRAATLAFGATFASATALVACGSQVAIYGAPGPSDGGANFGGAAGTAGLATGGSNVAVGGFAPIPVYGAPAAGGLGPSVAGAASGGSNSAAGSGSAGAAASGGASGGVGGGGSGGVSGAASGGVAGHGVVPVYGAPAAGGFGPGSAGSGNAGKGNAGGGPGPVYGAPP